MHAFTLTVSLLLLTAVANSLPMGHLELSETPDIDNSHIKGCFGQHHGTHKDLHDEYLRYEEALKNANRVRRTAEADEKDNSSSGKHYEDTILDIRRKRNAQDSKSNENNTSEEHDKSNADCHGHDHHDHKHHDHKHHDHKHHDNEHHDHEHHDHKHHDHKHHDQEHHDHKHEEGHDAGEPTTQNHIKTDARRKRAADANSSMDDTSSSEENKDQKIHPEVRNKRNASSSEESSEEKKSTDTQAEHHTENHGEAHGDNQAHTQTEAHADAKESTRRRRHVHANKPALNDVSASEIRDDAIDKLGVTNSVEDYVQGCEVMTVNSEEANETTYIEDRRKRAVMSAEGKK